MLYTTADIQTYFLVCVHKIYIIVHVLLKLNLYTVCVQCKKCAVQLTY